MLKLSIPVIILFFLASCSPQQEAVDLAGELTFAQIKEDFFINDYLRDDAEIYLEDGWSNLSKNGYRSGVYPRSSINFHLIQKRPLYLFSQCMPTQKEGYSAEKIAVRVNGNILAEEELKANMPRFLILPVPLEVLNEGQNTLEFVYLIGASPDTEDIPEVRGERIFSVVFHRLILSTLSSLSAINRIERKQKSLLKPEKTSFFQNMPGEVNFFMKVPSEAVFQADCEFFGLDPDGSSTQTWELQISLKQSGRKDQILERVLVGRKGKKLSFDTDLSGYQGVGCLGFKVEGEQKEADPQGFLLWTNARILTRKSKSQEMLASNPDTDRARRSLQNNNTIIIIFDAARADRFSAYGHFRPTTPNADHFAQDGVIFQNAFSEALTTRASIGSLFTGFSLEVTGFKNIFSQLPENLTTLAQLFQNKGFKTAAFTGVGNISSEFGFNRGFDEYFDLFREEGFLRKSQEYIPYVFPWLEQNRDRRFFLYIHFKEPHAVYIPQPPFQGMFSEGFAQKTDLVEYMDKARDLTEEQVEYIRACYDENLASADSVFGELVHKLNELELLEKTNIILTSDHGELLGEKERMFGHGSYFGDGGIHIPLIIRFPRNSGIIAPQRLEGLVKMSDIFVSLADIYQFEINQELMEGVSFFPALFDRELEINPYVVAGRQAGHEYSLRSHRHKFIFFEKSGYKEYYDLAQDPNELNEIYSPSDIEANYLWVELKKWLKRQRFIRAVLFDQNAQVTFQREKIDKKTLENLKALGYIK